MTIKLIIGLKNPGSSYAHTRHNAGAWFVAALAATASASFNINKHFFGEISDIICENKPCKLLLPTTFMNVSGQAVRAVCQFYRFSAEELLIVHDDLDLLPGVIKFKTGGGHGGHNGLRDIIRQLGSASFHRLRIGIGHPGIKEQVHPYVLSKAKSQERQLIDNAIAQALSLVPKMLEGDYAQVMSLLGMQAANRL